MYLNSIALLRTSLKNASSMQGSIGCKYIEEPDIRKKVHLLKFTLILSIIHIPHLAGKYNAQFTYTTLFKYIKRDRTIMTPMFASNHEQYLWELWLFVTERHEMYKTRYKCFKFWDLYVIIWPKAQIQNIEYLKYMSVATRI